MPALSSVFILLVVSSGSGLVLYFFILNTKDKLHPRKNTPHPVDFCQLTKEKLVCENFLYLFIFKGFPDFKCVFSRNMSQHDSLTFLGHVYVFFLNEYFLPAGTTLFCSGHTSANCSASVEIINIK